MYRKLFVVVLLIALAVVAVPSVSAASCSRWVGNECADGGRPPGDASYVNEEIDNPGGGGGVPSGSGVAGQSGWRGTGYMQNRAYAYPVSGSKWFGAASYKSGLNGAQAAANRFASKVGGYVESYNGRGFYVRGYDEWIYYGGQR